jgi:hypothetical protein
MSSTNHHDHDDDEKVATLTAMGFGADEAKTALRQSSGNLEYAANLLLTTGGAGSGGGGDGEASTSSSFTGWEESGHNDSGVTNQYGDDDGDDGNDGTVVLAALSQYDFSIGRSACTCIALAAAESILLQQQQQQQHNGSSLLPSEILTASLYRGHEIYQNHHRSSSLSVMTTEHTSAEDLLPLFTNLQLLVADDGGSVIRQGLLTSDGAGWRNLLRTTESTTTNDGAGSAGGTAFIITKPPETILVYHQHHSSSSLTPAVAAASAGSTSSGCWWLFDSHNRPPQYRTAYAIRYNDQFDALVKYLQQLFPYTPSIPGVPSEMMAMYNSVDVYPLVLSTTSAEAAASLSSAATEASAATCSPSAAASATATNQDEQGNDHSGK